MQRPRSVPAPHLPDTTSAQRPISGIQPRATLRRTTIGDQPLPLWLIKTLDKRVNATLVLTTHNGEHRVHLRDGRPIAVESPSDIAPLSVMLHKQKAVSAEALQELDTQREDPSALLRFVEPGVLRRTVDLRAMLRATALFTLRPDTIVDLGPAMEPPEESAIELSPIALITRGLRGLAGRTERDVVASLFGDRTLAVHPDARIEELELLRFEMQVVEALHESPRTFAELEELGLVHPRALCATLYILHQMRFLTGSTGVPVAAWSDDGKTPIAHLDVDEPTHVPGIPLTKRSEPAPSLPRPRPAIAVLPAAVLPASGPMSRRAEPRREPGAPKVLVNSAMPTVAELDERLAAMEGETFFEMLNVASSATIEEIRAGYAKQIFMYHPDRLPAEVSRTASKISAKLGDAIRTLSDASSRADYREQVERGGTTPSERLAVAMRAAKCYEQAERLVRTGDFQLAERLLYRAIADDGEQPVYLVLLAWCQAEALAIRPPPLGQLTDALDAQLRMLQKALRNEPNDARARYYFAQLLKRSGRVDGAIRQFKIVLNLQPHNIGAAREIRIHEMRKRHKEEGGLLNRLLRRKD